MIDRIDGSDTINTSGLIGHQKNLIEVFSGPAPLQAADPAGHPPLRRSLPGNLIGLLVSQNQQPMQKRIPLVSQTAMNCRNRSRCQSTIAQKSRIVIPIGDESADTSQAVDEVVATQAHSVKLLVMKLKHIRNARREGGGRMWWSESRRDGQQCTISGGARQRTGMHEFV